ncbi:MAG: hypothetical protein Q4D02_04755 [Clostridia bacterium]|nr:hypothetical protein [Clostridia bacterium]
MKKQEFLKTIDGLNLDKQKYCIISGGVMLMYGLREETEDIDLKIIPELFDELNQKYATRKSEKFSYLYELTDSIELAVLDFSQDDVVWIDGYPVESLEKQLEWKLANHRLKDEEDIRRIKEYLHNKENTAAKK